MNRDEIIKEITVTFCEAYLRGNGMLFMHVENAIRAALADPRLLPQASQDKIIKALGLLREAEIHLTAMATGFNPRSIVRPLSVVRKELSTFLFSDDQEEPK